MLWFISATRCVDIKLEVMKMLLLVLVVAVWEGGGICTVNLWAVKDTGVVTLEVTDWTDEVPVSKNNTTKKFRKMLFLSHAQWFRIDFKFKRLPSVLQRPLLTHGTHLRLVCLACWTRHRRWGEAQISCQPTKTPRGTRTGLSWTLTGRRWGYQNKRGCQRSSPSSVRTSACSWALSGSSGLEEVGGRCRVWLTAEGSGFSVGPPPARTESRGDAASHYEPTFE